jgi:hypothetical protein
MLFVIRWNGNSATANRAAVRKQNASSTSGALRILEENIDARLRLSRSMRLV